MPEINTFCTPPDRIASISASSARTTILFGGGRTVTEHIGDRPSTFASNRLKTLDLIFRRHGAIR